MLLFLLVMACAPEEVATEEGFVPNGCGAAAALQHERRWSWQSVEGADTQSEWETEVRVLRDISARLWTQGSSVGPALSQDYSRTTELECGDGTWLLSEETQSAGLEGGVAFSRTTELRYDAPVQLWPADVENGTTWQSHYLGTSKTEDVSTPIDYTITHEVKAPAELELEAGAFRAFQVLATDSNGMEWRYWVAREVGVVKGPDYELTALW